MAQETHVYLCYRAWQDSIERVQPVLECSLFLLMDSSGLWSVSCVDSPRVSLRRYYAKKNMPGFFRTVRSVVDRLVFDNQPGD